MTGRATFKELCMDTGGGESLGRFWAQVLGLRFEPDGAAGDVVGDEEGHGIAMCVVPEAKTVKHRVHLDVKTDSVASLEALGATVLRSKEESGLGWTVMADPEGGEFCAFERTPAELSSYRGYALVVDAADAREIADWWGEVFGVPPSRTEGEQADWYSLDGVPGLPMEGIVFVPVPEHKTVKNRIHWDVYGDVGALEAAGATVLWERPRWTTMADPEGNEFCVFTPPDR